MHFSPLFTHFSASPKGQGQTTASYCKNGEFHSDPVCTDPVQNFPTNQVWELFRGVGAGGLAEMALQLLGKFRTQSGRNGLNTAKEKCRVFERK